MTEKALPKTAFKKGEKRPGQGRPKGVLNKNNQQIRDMIANALDNLGGASYLEEVARSHPPAFMALIGKTMPLQVQGDPSNPVKLEFSWKSSGS